VSCEGYNKQHRWLATCLDRLVFGFAAWATVNCVTLLEVETQITATLNTIEYYNGVNLLALVLASRLPLALLAMLLLSAR